MPQDDKGGGGFRQGAEEGFGFLQSLFCPCPFRYIQGRHQHGGPFPILQGVGVDLHQDLLAILQAVDPGA